MVDLSSGSFEESQVSLNSGLRLPAEHIIVNKKENRGNIHLLNGKVLMEVPLNSIDFDKDENEIALKIASGEIPDPATKSTKRCCGG